MWHCTDWNALLWLVHVNPPPADVNLALRDGTCIALADGMNDSQQHDSLLHVLLGASADAACQHCPNPTDLLQQKPTAALVNSSSCAIGTPQAT